MELQATTHKHPKREARAYGKIQELVLKLSKSTKITERRELGNRLRDDLAKYEVRRLIAQEATPETVGPDKFSPAATRCKALQSLWSSVLTAAIGVAKKAVEKPNKTRGMSSSSNSSSAFQMDDIRLTNRLLVICGKTDDEYDTSGLTIPRVPEKIVRELVELYKKLLDDEKIQSNPKYEAETLEMLEYLCSKPEYVGFFQYRRDFDKIFDRVLERLDKEVDFDTPAVFLASAKVLDTLIRTCEQIGIQLDIYASEIIRLVADWCETALSEPDKRHDVTHPTIIPLFRAVATTITAHPDHCIGPITRCGDFTFRYAQKLYPSVKPSYKDALNHYFLAHIFLAQVAGRIQGFVDGDFGDLGDANLSEGRLMTLLDLAIADTQQMVINTDTAQSPRGHIVNRSVRRSKKSIWTPLGSRERTHLDLIARLLAAVQRQYMARVSWNCIDNQSKTLETMLKKPGPDKYGPWTHLEVQNSTRVPSDKTIRSPWLSLIIVGLFSENPSSVDKFIENYVSMNDSDNRSIVDGVPQLSSIVKSKPRRESLCTFLAIIGACSERFPGGECWAMSPTQNWHNLKNVSGSSQDVVSFHVASSSDLAVVLEALAVVLEMNGGNDGRSTIQYWIVLTLTKLVKVSATLRQLDCKGLKVVTGAWRRIWQILFRSDLRYTVQTTSSLTENGLGEIILILLTEVIRYDCLDAYVRKLDRKPDGKRQQIYFGREHQRDVWSMELYRSNWIGQKRNIPAIFELLLSVLHYLGLVETSYEDQMESGGSQNATASPKSLRKRLLYLALHAFADASSMPPIDVGVNQVSEKLTSSIARCILALVYGKPFVSSHSWSTTDSRFVIVDSCCWPNEHLRGASTNDIIPNTLNSCLAHLWSEQSITLPRPMTSLNQLHGEKLDPSIVVARGLHEKLRVYELKSTIESTDFVESPDADQLLAFSVDFLRSKFDTPSEGGEDEDVEMNSSQGDDGDCSRNHDSLYAKAMKEKLFLSLLANAPKALARDDFFATASDVISFFTTTLSLLVVADINPDQYRPIAAELRKFAYSFVELHASTPSKMLAETMKDVIKKCRAVVVRYAERSRTSSNDPRKGIQAPKGESKPSLEDDLFEDSDEDQTPSKLTPKMDEIGFSPRSRKRALSDQFFQRKRHRTAGSLSSESSLASAVAPPDVFCCLEVAYILLALDPSPKNCRVVCESLLGVDLEMELALIEGDIDIRPAMDCVGILTSTPALLNTFARKKLFGNEDEDDDDSILLILCDVLDVIHANTMPSSPLSLLGSFEYAIATSKWIDSGLELSSEAKESIVSLISDETNLGPFYNCRPLARFRRLDASVTAFRKGDSDFHKLFDGIFVRGVKMGFDDRSFLVRKNAILVAGMAIGLLDEEKIRETISNMTAPVVHSPQKNEDRDRFTSWYKSSGVGRQNSFNKTMQTDDARIVLEPESIYARQVVASMTKSHSSFQAVVFEICETASFRPDLELTCHKALEATALLRGYKGLGHLFDCESLGLIALWVQKSSKMGLLNHRFPLFMCGFIPFQQLMRYHQYDILFPGTTTSNIYEDFVGLRETAQGSFLAEVQPFLLPLSLVASYDAVPNTSDSQTMIDWLAKDPLTRLVFGAISDSNDNEQVVMKIMKKYVIEIEAFCSLLLFSGNPEDNARGNAVRNMASTVLTEDVVVRSKAKEVSLFIRRILDLLQLQSLCGMVPDDISVYELTLTKTINNIANSCLIGRKETLSLTYQSIFSLRALEAYGEIDHWQSAVWMRFELLGRLASTKSNSGQIGMFIHMLTEIALRLNIQNQTRLLALIKNILQQMQEDASELSIVVKRCLTVAFCILEKINCDESDPKASQLYIDLARSCPFHDSEMHKEVEERKALQVLHEDELECLKQAYTVIHIVIENPKKFGLTSFSSTASVPLLSQGQLRELSKFGLKYNGRIRTFTLMTSINTEIGSAIACLEEIRSSIHRMTIQPRNILDERALFSHIQQFEVILRSAEGSLPAQEALPLLIGICKSGCPLEIKFAATRCIGLFSPQSMIEMTKHIGEYVDQNEDRMHDIAQMLMLLIRSPIATNSLAAAGTLDVLLSAEIGAGLESLARFAPAIRGRSFYKTILSNEEVKVVKARCGLTSSSDSGMWCWDTKVWNLKVNMTMTLSDLTTAIIVCCFQPKTEAKNIVLGETAKIHNFFWELQRLTLISNEFATRVFPNLIVALVTESECAEENGAVISSAFQTLLSSKPEGTRAMPKDSLPHRAKIMVLDTLDVLRRHSQSAWRKLTSPRGKNNTAVSGKNSPTSLRCRAVPYGVMLHIDGLEVAHACMQIERYGSALLYLDLYLEAQLGTSGAIFERLSSTLVDELIVGFDTSSDIAGGMNNPVATADKTTVLPSTMTAVSYSIQCYKALGEFDAIDTLQNLLASISLSDKLRGQGVMILEKNETLGQHPLENLQALSIQAGFCQQAHPLRVVESFDELGLQGFITTYIDGLMLTHQSLTDTDDAMTLEDQWHKNNMSNWAWKKLLSTSTRHLNNGTCSYHSTDIHLKRSTSKFPGFFESVTGALEACMQNDSTASIESLSQARSSVVDMICRIREEGPALSSAFRIVDKSKALQYLDKLVARVEPQQRDISLEMSLFDVSWRMNEVVTVVEAARNSDRSRTWAEGLETYLWQIYGAAIQQRRPQVAEVALARIRSLMYFLAKEDPASTSSIYTVQAEIAEAKVMECRGNFKAATQRMAQIATFLSRNCSNGIFSSEHLLADAQLACGDWMTKYKTQPAKSVLRDYLEPGKELAIKICERDPSDTNTCRAVAASCQLGTVLALLYDDLRSRVESKRWKDEAQMLKVMEEQLEKIEHERKSLSIARMKKAEKDEKKKDLTLFENRISSELGDKRKQRQEVESSIPIYLGGAIDSLLLALKLAGSGCDVDLSSSVYRIISLWFGASENVKKDILLHINKCMMEATGQLPSFRFVPLTKQVFSRIDSDRGNGFQKALHGLLFKMCDDHPYHCLSELVALANGNVGIHGTSEKTGDSSMTSMERASKSKTESAQQMMNRLRKDGLPYVSHLVDSYRLLAQAYNVLAYTSNKNIDDDKLSKKSNIKFSTILSSSSPRLDTCLERLPLRPTVLTSVPRLQSSKDYGEGRDDPDGAERIKMFENTFDIATSGRSRPKIISCIGTKGGKFRQLVKGVDDVRQDSIMSQVFLYVNNLMDRRHSDGASKVRLSERRRLNVMRYEVVPLSPKSGVIEFVNKTTSFGSFVVSGPRHKAYFPDEWTCLKCHQHYDTVDRRKSSVDTMRKNLEEIFDKFSPSYRFFFLEVFGSNVEFWHTAKMNFTRSVAVSSIVGHILGIGDRHTSNILVHRGTGECLQIDFGIVFEQGKTLQIPEQVPFRLTRDMVDGMGPCGTQGTFTNVAEATLRVLRNHSSELLTILSSILADPSYGWRQARDPVTNATRTMAENGASDEQATEERNSEAIKAISKVKEKLSGYEDSTSGEQQGVEGQVQFLINSARDIEKLAQHFGGWMPWV